MSAEVQESGNKKKGSKQKKMTVRVDFTPMVDMNMLPSGSTNIERIFFSGILISETEAGVVTCTGSFFTNVDVSIKKVSNSTVTSLIAVMSMNVLFFLIFALPMILEFYRVSTFIYELQQMSAQ